MAVTTAELRNLVEIGREHWIEAHGTLLACEREFGRISKTSDGLKLATVLLAVVTAVTSQTAPSIVTTAAALLTAFVSAYEKNYAPAENCTRFWKCRSDLEGIKRELRTLAVTLRSVQDVQSGLAALNQIGSRLGAIVESSAILVSEGEKKVAQTAFGDTTISQILASLEGETEEMAETAVAEGEERSPLPYDAPGVIATVRPVAQGRAGGV